jgi:hypothetical protein
MSKIEDTDCRARRRRATCGFSTLRLVEHPGSGTGASGIKPVSSGWWNGTDLRELRHGGEIEPATSERSGSQTGATLTSGVISARRRPRIIVPRAALTRPAPASTGHRLSRPTDDLVPGEITFPASRFVGFVVVRPNNARSIPSRQSGG